jgi:hypothetical protein
VFEGGVVCLGHRRMGAERDRPRSILTTCAAAVRPIRS